jgi:hypothetical protein
VTLQEVIDHFRQLLRDPDCVDRLDVLLDVSGSNSLPDSDQIAVVTREVKRIQGKIRFNACAIVAGRDAMFGMLRMFEVMTQPYFRAISVFRKASEAERWLASQRESAK